MKPFTVKTAMDYLRMQVRHIQYTALQNACCEVIEKEKFQSGIGGTEATHHGFVGGLPVHVAEVLFVATTIAEAIKVDYNVLVTATVFHDCMKVEEYEVNPVTSTISKTQYRHRVRHVAGSLAEFVRITHGYSKEDIPPEIRMNIEHCIVSHHGRMEWGSPVEPQTPEAFILHYADMLSSRFGAKSPFNSLIGY